MILIVGRCFHFLNGWYGFSHGGNQYTKELDTNKSVQAVTQADIASKLRMSVDTLQNYKLLAEMIPELEDLVDTGIVTKDTAIAVIKIVHKLIYMIYCCCILNTPSGANK